MGGPSQEMWWPSSAKRVLRTRGKFLLHCSLVEMEKEEEELHSMVGRKVRDGSIVYTASCLFRKLLQFQFLIQFLRTLLLKFLMQNLM